MDSLITAAARALAAGDPLGALKRVALRDDAPGLALRGIAMAQLGDLVRAKVLLKRAVRAFSPKETVARARCVVAVAEIALASRDLNWPTKALHAARATLENHGDRVNAAHASYLEVRRLLLIGRIEEAERTLANLDPTALPPPSRAVHELMVAGIAMRRVRATEARAPLATLQTYKRRMGWTFPWASSFGGDFNFDFNISFTEEQQRKGGIEYNYRRGGHAMDATTFPEPVKQFAASCGTDAVTYTRDRPGMSAFTLDDGVIYHTYSTYARGLDGLWGSYQWLDRAPLGRNEQGVWWRRHDEYAKR